MSASCRPTPKPIVSRLSVSTLPSAGSAPCSSPTPLAAFTNIGSALRPGARPVQLVWQHIDRQEWSAVIREAFASEQPAPTPAAGPFSLADPATAGGILTASGFTDVDVTGVHEPVCYGPDTAGALHTALTLRVASRTQNRQGGATVSL